MADVEKFTDYVSGEKYLDVNRVRGDFGSGCSVGHGLLAGMINFQRYLVSIPDEIQPEVTAESIDKMTPTLKVEFQDRLNALTEIAPDIAALIPKLTACLALIEKKEKVESIE